jgi:transketolase
MTAVLSLDEPRRPSLWVLTELPIVPASIPADFWTDLRRSEHLCVVEEHAAHGGVGESLSRLLLLEGRVPARFTHRCALGYVSGLYGSQKFHRKECGLDPKSILDALGTAKATLLE